MSTDARARTARVLPDARLLILELSTGAEFAVSLEMLPALQDATNEQLAAVEGIGAGNIVPWPALDADFSVPALIEQAIANAQFARKRKSPPPDGGL